MIHTTMRFILAMFLCLSGASLARGKTWEVRAPEDYREVLPQLEPGDELVLHEGTYDGAAHIRVSGTAEKPIIIRGGSAGARPVLNWEGASANLWQISGEHLIVRHLEFRAHRAYGIRVGQAAHVTIEDCVFRECGGGDISANSAPVHGLRITRCQFLGSRRTPVYIGNHDGKLAITGFVFEGNVIDGSQVDGEGTIGYGIQLKLNVTGGVIRNNFIKNTKGPGIMVYGATNALPAAANRVEGNIVTGARNNPGIVVGGGPAVVRNNTVISCRAGGISVMDYGGRGLLDGILVVGNSALANQRFDFSMAGVGMRGTVEGNRALTRPGALGFRGASRTESENSSEVASRALVELADRFRGLLPAPEVLERAAEDLAPPASDDFQRLFDLLSAKEERLR